MTSIQSASTEDDSSEAMLAAIVSSSDDAIVSKSLDGVIRTWNEGAERIFGYTADEAIGQPITLIIPPELHDEERSILERLRRGERIEHYETVRVTKDGRRVDVSLTVSPMRDRSGRIVGASKVGRDITRRKKAEQALADADRRKDESLAMLAHELRNPLASLSNMLVALELRDDDPELRRQGLQTMRRQVALLVRLVDDLLDVARITGGKLKLRLSRIDLAETVRAVLDETRHLFEESNHELVVAMPEEPIFVDADAQRLGQVLTNLFVNAVRYTPPGGRIGLEVERRGAEARLAVWDTGVGIAPDKIDAVFEMFSQLEHSAGHRNPGLGIGLRLVKSLVELHGGRVAAESEGIGRGSRFEIRLPVATEGAPR